jgi:protein TonB
MTEHHLYSASPSYPKAAKKAHVSGAVIMKVIVNEQGDVESAEVVSGPDMLRDAATEAVKKWRYRPFALNGHTVKVTTSITFNFALPR